MHVCIYELEKIMSIYSALLYAYRLGNNANENISISLKNDSTSPKQQTRENLYALDIYILQTHKREKEK